MARHALGNSEIGGRVVLVVEDANHSDNRPGKLQKASRRFLLQLGGRQYYTYKPPRGTAEYNV